MKTILRVTFLIGIIGFIFYGCETANTPLGEISLNDEIPSVVEGSTNVLFEINFSDPVEIQNYRITFNGKSYDENSDQSTFSYTVNGTGLEPALNFFALEIPTCAGSPTAYTPTQSAKLAVNEIKWEASISSTSSRDYSITYNGDLPVGYIDATVESGNDTDTQEVPGPCKGVYTISGSVYVDGDVDQQKGINESGIQNVSVFLVDIDGNEVSRKTTSSGSYLFTVATGNSSTNFTVEVRPTTSEISDFNEQLFDTYTATTNPPSKRVTVNNTDVRDTNFGFVPQTQKLIQQFEDGTILLKTEEPKFWIKQLRFARNNNANGVVPKDSIVTYLIEIEQLLLETPFQFGTNKIDAALDILTKPIKTDLESLLVQLLTAELNIVSGRGSDSEDFDLALAAFGEAAAVLEAEVSGSSLQRTSISDISISAAISSYTIQAESLLTSFNSTGSGGGVGE